MEIQVASNDNKGIEVAVFTNKTFKSLVPRMNYESYEILQQDQN